MRFKHGTTVFIFVFSVLFNLALFALYHYKMIPLYPLFWSGVLFIFYLGFYVGHSFGLGKSIGLDCLKPNQNITLDLLKLGNGKEENKALISIDGFSPMNVVFYTPVPSNLSEALKNNGSIGAKILKDDNGHNRLALHEVQLP